MGENLKKVTVYTDGACSGNPGPGGWGAVLIYGENEKQLSGFEKQTTNNRMELTAVIMALKALKEKCCVNIYTDSSYVCNAFIQHWTDNWKRNGWKTSAKKPVENKDLWLELLDLCDNHDVHFNKVKGHADNKFNNLCDKLATDEIKNH